MNSHGGSHSSGGKVRLESSDDDSLLTVNLANLSPNSSELGSLFFGWGFINIHNSLTQVVIDLVVSIDIFDLHKGLVLGLVFSVSSESQEFGFDPESNGGLFVLAFLHLCFGFSHQFINK